jgi:hypothetical protein
MKTKMKTSLTLSREVVRGIDRVDDVLRGYLSHRERAAANARDAEKINRAGLAATAWSASPRAGLPTSSVASRTH